MDTPINSPTYDILEVPFLRQKKVIGAVQIFIASGASTCVNFHCDESASSVAHRALMHLGVLSAGAECILVTSQGEKMHDKYRFVEEDASKSFTVVLLKTDD